MNKDRLRPCAIYSMYIEDENRYMQSELTDAINTNISMDYLIDRMKNAENYNFSCVILCTQQSFNVNIYILRMCGFIQINLGI